MRSLEKSHKSADIDQVNPEHINRESAEFSWDDLSKVPFSGNQQQSPENTMDTTDSLERMIDNLSIDDENIQSKIEEENRRRAQDVFQEMDKVGSFGENARSKNRLSTQEANKTQEVDKNDAAHQDLSDISSTF